LSSDPVTGTSNVAINKPVRFTFLTAMAPVEKVVWSSNLDATKFSYAWSADGKTLTATYSGNFPVNTTITWILDPAVFKDTAGGALLELNNSGSFTTGSGEGNPNDPCNGGGGNDNQGVVSMFKSIQYVQTSAAAPAIDPDSGAIFSVYLKASSTNPVSQATLQLPSGATRELASLISNSFFFTEEFSTEAALEAAYPAGTYTLNLKQSTGSASMKLNLAASAPPTPHLTNFEQVQAFSPTADFRVQWDPFTGAAANDGIIFTMADQTRNFTAPDPCVPRELANTATFIIVPANTFGVGTDIDGSLTFSKSGGFDTNSIPGINGVGGYSKTTSFKPKVSGTPGPDQPILQNFLRLPNETVQFQVKGTAASVLVEASADLQLWVPVLTAPSPTGVLDVVDALAAGNPRRFYRATAR
jgi:hypothetical protein